MDRRLLVALCLHVVFCAAQVPTKPILAPTKPGCIVKSADIAIVVDASGSVDSAEWKQALDFATNLVNTYDIGRNKVRVAMIVFSNTAKIVFDFNKYTTKAQLAAAIAAAPKESQSTYTHLALDMARRQLFQPKSGMRANVPHILLVITDGQSTNKQETVKSAQALHRENVNVIAVGVKGANVDELKVIASAANLVYTYGDFGKLAQLQNQFTQDFCKAAVKFATVLPPTPAPTTAKPCVVESADIVFLVDASGSVGDTEWRQSLQFAKSVVNGFDIGSNKVRVAMATFSSSANLVFNLNKYRTKADVVSAISNAPKVSGGTSTHLGLDMVRQTLFKASNGDRASVPDLVFVITDGKSGSSTSTAASAKLLHQRKITVFAVGVKGANAAELKTIASDPKLVYSYQDFNKLAQIQDKFSKEACKVAVKLATNPPAPTKPQPFAGCSKNSADIVFVVDTSSSVGDANFNLTKTFLSSMMAKLDFNTIRAGIIQFNDGVKTVFELNQNNNLASAQSSVNRMTYDKGPDTRISAALKYLREHSFHPNTGDRANVPNIGILLTDGQGKDSYRTQYEGNLTKKAGIELFSVGIGADVNREELKGLASSPSFVTLLDDFTKLKNIRDILASKLCQGFTLPPTTTPAPCLCKDNDDDCAGYDTNKMCFQMQYREFAKKTCPVFCDICPPGCKKVYPKPKPCKDTLPDCASKLNICTDMNFRKYAISVCPRYCGLCSFINPTGVIQTTTASTTTLSTRSTKAVVTRPPPPTKPTPFVPCDVNCYDKARDCADYDRGSCRRKDFEGFFRSNCAEFCGFCTPSANCRTTPGPCADVQDCSGYSNDACVDYPGWAKSTCPKRCGLCPGGTPVVKGTTPQVCEDKDNDCGAYGKDMCTDYPNFAKTECRAFCGICFRPTTTPICLDKIDCSVYKPDDCINPDYRGYMKDKCIKFCKLC